jgi:hypothetical protein
MNDSTLSSAVVSRMLQVTRQSWTQALADPTLIRAPSVRKLSTHRLTVQQRARHPRPSWGLQPRADGRYSVQA